MLLPTKEVLGAFCLLLLTGLLLLPRTSKGFPENVTVDSGSRNQANTRAVYLNRDDNRFRALAPTVSNDVVILVYLDYINSLWGLSATVELNPQELVTDTEIGPWKINTTTGALEDSGGAACSLWETVSRGGGVIDVVPKS